MPNKQFSAHIDSLKDAISPSHDHMYDFNTHEFKTLEGAKKIYFDFDETIENYPDYQKEKIKTALTQAMHLWASYIDCEISTLPHNMKKNPDTRDGKLLTFGIEDHDQGYLGYTHQNLVFTETAKIVLRNLDNLDIYPGTKMFETALHEIGHALGLEHPGLYLHPYNNKFMANEVLEDNRYTVMSYFYHPVFLKAQEYSSTPMLADILAVQEIYGAKKKNIGDTTYHFTRNKILTIIDDGGNDTLSFARSQKPTFISLKPGDACSVSFEHRLQDNVILGFDTVIENAIGGAHHDILQGNDADNHLSGQKGQDLLIASNGKDILKGGDDYDGYLFSKHTKYDSIILDDGGYVYIETDPNTVNKKVENNTLTLTTTNGTIKIPNFTDKHQFHFVYAGEGYNLPATYPLDRSIAGNIKKLHFGFLNKDNIRIRKRYHVDYNDLIQFGTLLSPLTHQQLSQFDSIAVRKVSGDIEFYVNNTLITDNNFHKIPTADIYNGYIKRQFSAKGGTSQLEFSFIKDGTQSKSHKMDIITKDLPKLEALTQKAKVTLKDWNRDSSIYLSKCVDFKMFDAKRIEYIQIKDHHVDPIPENFGSYDLTPSLELSVYDKDNIATLTMEDFRFELVNAEFISRKASAYEFSIRMKRFGDANYSQWQNFSVSYEANTNDYPEFRVIEFTTPHYLLNKKLSDCIYIHPDDRNKNIVFQIDFDYSLTGNSYPFPLPSIPPSPFEKKYCLNHSLSAPLSSLKDLSIQKDRLKEMRKMSTSTKKTYTELTYEETKQYGVSVLANYINIRARFADSKKWSHWNSIHVNDGLLP